jgi:hypothetical protein
MGWSGVKKWLDDKVGTPVYLKLESKMLDWESSSNKSLKKLEQAGLKVIDDASAKVEWIKENPNTTLAVASGVAAAGVLAYRYRSLPEKPMLDGPPGMSRLILRPDGTIYGKTKKDGSHDHRTNQGGDRTPSQKSGDKLRRGR